MKKNIMKRISFIMVVTIIIVGFTPSFTSAAGSDNVYGDYLVETIISKKEYTKQKITNTITEEIEWLESYYFDNGTSRFISTSELNEDVDIIENDLKEITVKKNGEILETINLLLLEEDTSTEELTIDEESNSEITPYAYGPWSSKTWRKSSRSFRVSNVGSAIAIVAALLKVSPKLGIAIEIGTRCFSAKIKNVYYKISTQTRFNYSNYKHQVRELTYIYSVSDYTGLQGVNQRVFNLNR